MATLAAPTDPMNRRNRQRPAVLRTTLLMGAIALVVYLTYIAMAVTR